MLTSLLQRYSSTELMEKLSGSIMAIATRQLVHSRLCALEKCLVMVLWLLSIYGIVLLPDSGLQKYIKLAKICSFCLI